MKKFNKTVENFLNEYNQGSSFKETFKINVSVFKKWMKNNKQYTFEFSGKGKSGSIDQIETIYDKKTHVGTYNYGDGELHTTEISIDEFKGL